jgi:spore maturation protein CgeB
MKLVVLGLSITSSWGNGHATTYRGLLREFTRRGHEVTFLERDASWYAAHRDLPNPVFCATRLYQSFAELQTQHERLVAEADAVILGSYVREGVAVGEWVCGVARGIKAFYDIDTPVTLAKLARRDHEYLAPHLIPRFDLYLSFTGGPTLRQLERELGAPMARALYCSVDERLYRPQAVPLRWDLGYLGTYSADRQPKLDRLLLQPARELPGRRFVVAGPQYPAAIDWPANVERIEHLPPPAHPGFYAGQRFTLNVTRADMVAAGWSPSVRLFEAASCGVPIVSDVWDGLAELFRPGEEIFLAESGEEVARILQDCKEPRRRAVAGAARARVLQSHTAAVRAQELEAFLLEAARCQPDPRRAAGG